MKMSIKAIIKKIASLEDQKNMILQDERKNCSVTYQTADDRIDPDYNFFETRNSINEIDFAIRNFKLLLNYTNTTAVVDEFKQTISECMIEMAQLNNQKNTLEHMSRSNQKSRNSGYNGTVEYTEMKYDVNACKTLLQTVKDRVVALQLAIDLTNGNYMVEVNI